jgi:hypothetical protein
MDPISCDGVVVVLAVVVIAGRDFGFAVAEEAFGACCGRGVDVLRFFRVVGQRGSGVSSLL